MNCPVRFYQQFSESSTCLPCFGTRAAGQVHFVQLSENTFIAHFILSLGSMAVLSQLTLLGAQRRHGCGGSGGVGQLLLDRGASPVAAPLAVEVTSVVVIIVGRLIVLLEINNQVGVEYDLIKYLSKIQGCVLGPKLFLAMGCVKLGEKNCVHLPSVGEQTAN